MGNGKWGITRDKIQCQGLSDDWDEEQGMTPAGMMFLHVSPLLMR